MSDKHHETVAALAADGAAAAAAEADKVFGDATSWLAEMRREQPGSKLLCVALQHKPLTQEMRDQLAVGTFAGGGAADAQCFTGDMERHEVFMAAGALLLLFAQRVSEGPCKCPGCQRDIQIAGTVGNHLLARGVSGAQAAAMNPTTNQE